MISSINLNFCTVIVLLLISLASCQSKFNCAACTKNKSREWCMATVNNVKVNICMPKDAAAAAKFIDDAAKKAKEKLKDKKVQETIDEVKTEVAKSPDVPKGAKQKIADVSDGEKEIDEAVEKAKSLPKTCTEAFPGGKTETYCSKVPKEDRNASGLDVLKNLPTNCKDCVVIETNSWCVADVMGFKTKFCTPTIHAATLCANGKPERDCDKIAEEDRETNMSLSQLNKKTCQECVEGEDKSSTWCITKIAGFKLKGCVPDKYNVACKFGDKHKTCKDLSVEDTLPSSASGLSTFVTFGVLLLATLII